MVKSGVYHDIRTMILALDHSTCVALPCFICIFWLRHSVQSFYSKGKCKGWDVWMQNSSDFDEIFIRLRNRPSDVTEAGMNVIEYFVMKMYTKLSKISSTNLRINMFKSLTDKDLRKLPPSRKTLEQHTRRACYQAGYVCQESVSDLAFLNPKNWR